MYVVASDAVVFGSSCLNDRPQDIGVLQALNSAEVQPSGLPPAYQRMKLWAIADIHLSFKSNREEWAKLKAPGPDDGLILAGDGAQ